MREKLKTINIREAVHRIKAYRRMLETGESLEQALAAIKSEAK